MRSLIIACGLLSAALALYDDLPPIPGTDFMMKGFDSKRPGARSSLPAPPCQRSCLTPRSRPPPVPNRSH